jgi:hypothetical protein
MIVLVQKADFKVNGEERQFLIIRFKENSSAKHVI